VYSFPNDYPLYHIGPIVFVLSAKVWVHFRKYARIIRKKKRVASINPKGCIKTVSGIKKMGLAEGEIKPAYRGMGMGR